MAGETGVVDYNGTDRPWDSIIEPVFGGPLKPGYSKKRWLHADGSGYKGYQYPSGQLVGVCDTISPARQALLTAAANAAATEKALDDTFLAEMDALAVAIRDNTATAAQQRRFTVKLYRMIKGILRDL